MKKFLTLSILLLGFISYGQTFEQTVADASCECIQELPDLTDENYKNCISTSLTEALVKGDVKRNMKQIGTVKGMKSTLEKVYGILAESCSLNANKELKQKREVYYSASPNYEANISYNMGKDFMEQGNYQLAIKSFEKALENDENFVLALDDIAISYRQLNQFDEAITYYKKSLAVFPEGDFALMNIAVVYNLKEDYKTSNEYYAQLMQYQPHNA
ncbi:tetratricopeptide repeat protein [Kaistella sp.]|uniref:tetratricopeptide repeat protein n=1 Tax=Kaistella sp. TaxID=2782235 RepID=UPI0035A1AC89